MLEIENIHTYYGKSHILNDVSLNVKKSQVVALLGRNGMGKTTTVFSIIGFTPPNSGIIRFKGQEIQRIPCYNICQMGIGLVPQGRRIFPSLSVYENLIIGGRGKGWNLDKIFSLFPILKARAKHKGSLLSGGEQQMLSIARALLTNPDFLLMDEPSEGLAPLIVEEVGDIIEQLKNDGYSILLVEQNISLAFRASDYAYIMHLGEIVYHCSCDELSENQNIQDEYIGVAK